jgi:hypothetical protein
MTTLRNDIKCFISHAWRDGGHDFAKTIAKELNKNGIDAWLDENEIIGGEILDSEMISGVRNECNVFIFVLSPASIESEKCAKELDEALIQRERNGLQIIPILFKSCDIPIPINNLLYIDFRNINLFQLSMHKLIKSIKELSQIHLNISLLIKGTYKERLLAAQVLASKRPTTILPILKACFMSEKIALIKYEIVMALGKVNVENSLNILTELQKIEKDPYVLMGIEDSLQEVNSKQSK